MNRGKGKVLSPFTCIFMTWNVHNHRRNFWEQNSDGQSIVNVTEKQVRAFGQFEWQIKRERNVDLANEVLTLWSG